MTALLFSLRTESGPLADLAHGLGLESGRIEWRRFPDGESYVRVRTPVEGRDVVLFCSLDHPDEKALALLFAADAARQQGARTVGLVAPYLAYLRQDKAFALGEAVTSRSFARLISGSFDWLVTVEPHLHRYPALDAVYALPATAVSAAAPVADWLRANIASPFVIGPDAESRLWVERIATLADVPWAVLGKRRHGDFDVSIDAGGLDIPDGATPVIVDDVASTASTLIRTVELLKGAGHAAPCCIVIHPLFAGDAYERLVAAGAGAVASTNTIPHASNRIDLSAALKAAVRDELALPLRKVGGGGQSGLFRPAKPASSSSSPGR